MGGLLVVSVSHLMFAYDSLLLSRTNLLAVDQRKSILAHYEILFSQCSNFGKSSVTFGKHCHGKDPVQISQQLGVLVNPLTGNYLGMPLTMGRYMSLDRVWKRLSGWKDKFLSPAGKEILIKVIIKAILSYVMNCFRVPKNICSKITRMTVAFCGEAKFYWSNILEEIAGSSS